MRKRLIVAAALAVAILATGEAASANPPDQAQDERACLHQQASPHCGATPLGYLDTHNETLVAED